MIYRSDYVFELTPLTDNENLEFNKMVLEESIYGDLPTLTVEFTTESGNEVDFDLRDVEFYLNSIEDNFTIKCSGYISDIIVDSRLVTYNITLCEYSYILEGKVRALSDNIQDSLDYLNKRVILKMNSNVNDSDIFQNGETDYGMTKKLLSGYNKDVVYGFSVKGLIINNYYSDPIEFDHYGSSVPEETLLTFTKSKFYDYEEAEIDNSLRYFDSVSGNEGLVYTDKKTSEFLANRMDNFKLMNSRRNVKELQYIGVPPLDITDRVMVNKDVNDKSFLIGSRNILFDNNIITKLTLIDAM